MNNLADLSEMTPEALSIMLQQPEGQGSPLSNVIGKRKKPVNKRAVLDAMMNQSRLMTNPGEARNIPHGRMFALSQAIKRNPISNFAFGGVADFLETTSQGQKTSTLQNLFGGLDMPGPGTALKGGKLTLESLMSFGAMVKAFHGTPHKVDKFRMDKIGTGEGAQAYGHGLYFAENPKVAGGYADKLAEPSGVKLGADKITYMSADKNTRDAIDLVDALLPNKDPSLSAFMAADKVKFDLAKKNGIRFAKRKGYDDVAETLEKLEFAEGGGNLYNVNLDVNKSDLLDWDLPISDDILEKVRDSTIDYPNLGEVWKYTDDAGAIKTRRPTGAEVYGMLGGGKMGSKKLKELGIPGIKYLDQGSRTGGKGTHNIVMFDENLIEINK